MSQESLPVAVRVPLAPGDSYPSATCPECRRVVQIRADGASLYNHVKAPRQRCPLSRVPVRVVDPS